MRWHHAQISKKQATRKSALRPRESVLQHAAIQFSEDSRLLQRFQETRETRQNGQGMLSSTCFTCSAATAEGQTQCQAQRREGDQSRRAAWLDGAFRLSPTLV